MFTISEIEIENKNDIFPKMYLFLARNIAITCGRGGEGAVREALRCYGAACGLALKKKHQEKNQKLNIKSYYCSSDLSIDTRKRENILRLNEEVCLKEIYTCPYADIWKRYEASSIGNWFCEEYEKAKFEAYTDGSGQAHLSSRLTCNTENNCRFSMYYRRANLSPKEAEKCFTNEIYKEAEITDYNDMFYISEAEKCLELYYAIFESAHKRFDHEGICAVANGLRALTEDLITTLRTQAAHTLHCYNSEFVKNNFSLPLLITDPIYIIVSQNTKAISILQNNLLDPIQKSLEY